MDLDLDLVPVGIVQFGVDRRVAAANAAAQGLLGFPPGRVVGRSLMEAFLDARVEAAFDAIPRGGSATAEVKVGSVDRRTLAVWATRLADGRLVAVLEDVTEGGSQLRLEDDVDLGRLAETSAERLRLLAERSGVALRTEIDPGVPRVRGDRERLGQVIVNLVHNAVKFSPDGGDVTVSVRPVDAGVEVAVADHGIGIARADRSRIVERFYKVDRARARGTGSGLGLAIACHVVEGHGGTIRVTSQEGEGSTFTVTIPAAPVAVA